MKPVNGKKPMGLVNSFNMYNKKILITGGAGFIGSNLALHLLDRGHRVTVLDNLSPQIHGDDPITTSPLFKSINEKVIFIKGDVTKYDDWKNAISDNDVIVHFAAETGTGQSMYKIDHYTGTNIGGTSLLLDILANTPTQVEKIVVASSRSIYGEGKYLSKKYGIVYPVHRTVENMNKGYFEVTYADDNEPLQLMATDEESKIHPSSVYGITKQCQEQMIMTVCPTIGIAGVAFRYQNVYGPGQSLTNPYTGILSIFSTRIKNNNEINIFEDGLESRDFVYIDDVVAATILGIEKDEANNNVFNVGIGETTNVLTVAQTLMKCYGVEVPIRISGNYRLGDIRHNFADISKAKSILGFNPSWTFEDGIASFTKWVNGQVLPQDKYEASIEEMKTKGLYK